MKKRKWIIAIAAVAVAVRLIYLFESRLRNPTFFCPLVDAGTYDSLAVAWVSGNGMGPESVWQPLFYPYFLGLCYTLFGHSFVAVRLIQCILGLLTCAGTYLLGRRLFSTNVGLLAMALAAVCGPSLFYEGELLAASLAAFWVVASLLAILVIDRRRAVLVNEVNGAVECRSSPPRWWQAHHPFGGFFLFGVMGAVGVVIRPPLLACYVASLAWLLFRRMRAEGWSAFRKSSTRGGALECGSPLIKFGTGYAAALPEGSHASRIRPGDAWPGESARMIRALHRPFSFPLCRMATVLLPALSGLIAGVLLIILPVMARNHASTGRWIFFPVSGGLNFSIGNNPDADRTMALRPGEEWYRFTVSPREEGIFHAVEGAAYHYAKAFDFIRNAPISFLTGLARKTTLFFNAREIPRNVDIYLFRNYSLVLSLLVWKTKWFAFPMGLVIPAALLGFLLSVCRGGKRVLLHLFFVAYAASVILFLVCARYRVPLLPLFCIYSAAGIVWCSRAVRARNRRRVLAGGSLFLVLAVAVNFPLSFPGDDVNYESELYLALGACHAGRGELDKAGHYFRETLAVDPGNADAHHFLGALSLQQGREDMAKRELSRAIELDSGHISARMALGLLFQQRGEWEKARKHYRAAVEYDPGNPQLCYRLAVVCEQKGESAAAVRWYWKTLELRPDHVPARRALAMLLGGEGRWETARELIAEAVRHEPDNAVLRCDLGVIYNGMGLKEKALAEFQRALSLDPGVTAARMNIRLLRSEGGREGGKVGPRL